VVQTTESIVGKYLFLVTWSFIVTLLLSHLFIRPSRLLRPLFGMARDGARR
jgi:hypothetical protein